MINVYEKIAWASSSDQGKHKIKYVHRPFRYSIGMAGNFCSFGYIRNLRSLITHLCANSCLANRKGNN